MKRMLLLCLTGVAVLAGCDEERTKHRFTFADKSTSANILTADDNYMNRMEPAEIAIRTASPAADKTVDDLKAQYRKNTLDWTPEEQAQIRQLIADNQAQIDGVRHLLPAEVTFIKVTDKVEGGLPHTRGHAIVIPAAQLPLSETIFYHELFHVLSRHQQDRHESLYGLIDFQPCDFTAEGVVKARSLTNPDVPAEGYYLPVEIDGAPAAVMTHLHATRDAFDPAIERGFGGHFGFGLLQVTVDDARCKMFTDAAGKARILSPAAVPGFFAAIGRNTNYIIHPEEVLADNFVFAMTGKKDLPHPEIPERLKAWLDRK